MDHQRKPRKSRYSKYNKKYEKGVVIGELYIKLNREFEDPFSENLLAELKAFYGAGFARFSRNADYSSFIGDVLGIFRKDVVSFEVEVYPGSTKVKIAIIATSIYMGIANYGDFIGGVETIIDHVKWFERDILNVILEERIIVEDEITNRQFRTGVPGRISRLMRRIEKLDRNTPNLSNIQIQDEVRYINRKLEEILTDLDEQDRQLLVDNISDDYKQQLPEGSMDDLLFWLRNRTAVLPSRDEE